MTVPSSPPTSSRCREQANEPPLMARRGVPEGQLTQLPGQLPVATV
jgi:hypothetical protein